MADQVSTDPPPALATLTAPLEEELHFSKDALRARLDREAKKAQAEMLKSLGFESPEAFAAWRARADELAKASEEAERSKLSEMERFKADIADRDRRLSELEAKHQEAITQAEAARLDQRLTALLAEKKVVDIDYALFKLEQKVDTVAEGDDPIAVMSAYVDELLTDPRERIKLGIDAASAPVAPAQTTAPKKGPEPVPAGNGTPKRVDQLTDVEWKAFKRQMGIAV